MKREHKVGERFTLPSVTLEVVAQSGCDGCYFNDEVFCYGGRYVTCSARHREDKTDVIFREVSPTIDDFAHSSVAAAVGNVDFAYIIAHRTAEGEISIKIIGKPENIGKLKECMIKMLEAEK